MAQFNFPFPVLGLVVIGPNGAAWQWDGEKWKFATNERIGGGGGGGGPGLSDFYVWRPRAETGLAAPIAAEEPGNGNGDGKSKKRTPRKKNGAKE